MTLLVATNFDAAEWAAWWPALQAAFPGETLVRARTDAAAHAIDVALVANPPAGALQGLPALRLIQSLWAGVDPLLADATVPAGVPLARMVDPVMNEAMAQTAAWAVLALHRGFFGYARQQRDRRWEQRAQRRADEVAVGVLGLGQMGQAVARRLVAGGYRVRGWSGGAGREAIAGVDASSGEGALADLLGAVDIVVDLLPLTAATRGLFDAARLAQMKPGASLVNLARGAHVVDDALLAALDGGALAHAVLDVFATEPLPAQHRYWSHERVTVLPHVAALTDPRSAAQVAAANVRRARHGEPLQHLVDRVRGY